MEKAFNKFQHLFMIKNYQYTKTRKEVGDARRNAVKKARKMLKIWMLLLLLLLLSPFGRVQLCVTP